MDPDLSPAPPDPDRARSLRRYARIAGAVGAVATLAVLSAVSSVKPAIPFPPAALAEAAIRATPGDIATFFIELLQHWTLRLLTLVALVGAVLVGAEAMVRTSYGERSRPFVAAAIVSAGAGLSMLASPGESVSVGAGILVCAVSLVVFGVVAGTMYRRISAESATDMLRRRVLRVGLGGAAAMAVGGSGLSYLLRKLGGPDTNVAIAEPEAGVTPPSQGDFPAISGHTPLVTSAEDHYVVDINIVQPSVEAEGWTLSVRGAVAIPLELDFDGLQERFTVVEEYSVLSCISNEIGGDLVGHSAWLGVRLTDVLDAAEIDTDEGDVVFRSADGYSDSITLQVARDPRVLLAIGQNGQPLSREHGFPCRVRIPAIYGMKNAKWLQSIEVVRGDYRGYWQERGWSDGAEVQTSSRIDVAGIDLSARTGDPTWVAGIAWAGERGISRVEVSVDGGQSWSEARLETAASEVSWTRWAYEWTPEGSGPAKVVCRAVDGLGAEQEEGSAPPHPSGATGYHYVSVDVA